MTKTKIIGSWQGLILAAAISGLLFISFYGWGWFIGSSNRWHTLKEAVQHLAAAEFFEKSVLMTTVMVLLLIALIIFAQKKIVGFLMDDIFLKITPTDLPLPLWSIKLIISLMFISAIVFGFLLPV